MIDSRMERIEILIPDVSVNKLGNKPNYINDRFSYMSLSSNITGRFNGQVDVSRYVSTASESSYALSYDYDIKVRDKIISQKSNKVYEVLSANLAGRYNQLILKEVF